MKTKLLLTTLTILCLLFKTSCNDDDLLSRNDNQPIFSVSNDPNIELKKEFGKALAKVLSEDKYARELVKNEALNQINYDYDVLYLLVKDQELSNGTTLEQLLLKHLTIEQLVLIEEKIPNLTIFVPKLPENSFSAELWNIESDIPEVAIKEEKNPDVIIYNSSGEEYTLEAEYVPGFPVVVVKENERIVISNNNDENTLRSTTNSLTKLKFIDNYFNNINLSELRSRSSGSGGRIPPTDNSIPKEYEKIVQAYNIYKGTDGWQRDYIYYDLTPTNTKGRFKNTYKEHIVAFELLGDSHGAFNKISDAPQDPKMTATLGDANRTSSRRPKNWGWTDGEFEFKVKVYLGTKSAFGNELITYFRAEPGDLFDISWNRDGRKITEVYSRPRKFANVNLPLFEWNLENYSESIKISIEEVDSQETYESTTTTSTEFATNFSYEPSFGEKVKVGLKFGSSQKETRTTAFKVTRTQGNDELGEVIINFGDNIVASENIYTQTNIWGGITYTYKLADFSTKYSTGWYRIYIAPLPVN